MSDFTIPKFDDALKTLELIDEPSRELNADRANKILLDLGFGHYDTKKAFDFLLKNAYEQKEVDKFKIYLTELKKNISLGVPVSFFGSNGSGKTNGMAALARQIIYRYWEKNSGIDGRVGISMLLTTCYSMIEDIVANELSDENIYTVVRLLMIDDVDRDYTQHRKAAFQSVIAARSRQIGKPFFLTTALSYQEFSANFPHVYSRLKTGIVLQTKNIDLRTIRK